MKIEISQIKKWREQIDASIIVVFAITKDGMQHVATHGETAKNAKEAAQWGNSLKKTMNWPDKLCHEEPLERICKNCTYYKADYGIHCFNGWTGDGSNGFCLYENPRLNTMADNKCARFEPAA